VTPANPSARDGRNRRLELEYDYMGRRIRKVAYAWDDVAEDWETAPDMDLRYLYDGWNLVQEIDGLVEVESGVTDVAREYTWGLDLSGQSGNPSVGGIHGAGGIGGLLATHWTSNTTSTSDDKAYIYFYDANGNVGQMIDVVSGTNYGAIAAKYEYYPFGGLLAIDGVAAEANPFRFSTKYRDNETGCYYYGYRYLRTKHGRWLSRDPIGNRGGSNLMRFVGNHPISLFDPLGLQSWGDVIPPVSGDERVCRECERTPGQSSLLKGLYSICKKECDCVCDCTKNESLKVKENMDRCLRECRKECKDDMIAIYDAIKRVQQGLYSTRPNRRPGEPNCSASSQRLAFELPAMRHISCSAVTLDGPKATRGAHTVVGCRAASCPISKIDLTKVDSEMESTGRLKEAELWDFMIDLVRFNTNKGTGDIITNYGFNGGQCLIIPPSDADSHVGKEYYPWGYKLPPKHCPFPTIFGQCP